MYYLYLLEYANYSVQVTEDVVLNEAVISDFKQGLRSVDLFELPESVAFDEILMADLFLSEGRINMKIRPFQHFRCVSCHNLACPAHEQNQVYVAYTGM